MYKTLVDRRGEAAVIGTVLLIVAVLVSGGIVAYYTIQQVKSVDTSCFEALNSIQFQDIGYSCRMLDASGGPLTTFSMRIADDKLEGFQLGLKRGGTTDTYEIKNGVISQDVCLLDSGFGQPLVIPSPGDTLTYVLRGNFEQVFVAPILKGGKGCYAESRKDVTIENECVNPEVETRIVTCFNGVTSTCGNGQLEGSEECDDSNTQSGDGCSSSCSIEGAQLPCIVTNPSWSLSSVREGTNVNLLASLSNCNGKTISFAVYEDDNATDAVVVPAPNSIVVGIGATSISQGWITQWLSDAASGEQNPPEYYFTLAVQNGGTYSSPQVIANELRVTACGDGIVQSPEACDGTNMSGTTCVSLPNTNYTGGTLGCYLRGNANACTFNASSCTGAASVCGNGVLESGETCDDGDVGSGDGCSSTCQTESNWVCSSQPSVCTRCGNGQIDAGEQCDGNVPQGVTCQNYGGVGGSLTCTSSCTISTASCSFCGDNLVGAGETCDPPGSSCSTSGSSNNQGGGTITGAATSGSGGSGVCSQTCTSCDMPAQPLLDGLGWQQTTAVQGESVSFQLTGMGIGGLPLEIEIWENDPLGDDLITTITDRTGMSNGVPLTVTLAAPWQCDLLFGFLCDMFEGTESELYLVARVTNVPSSDFTSSNILLVSEGLATCGNGLVQAGEQCDPPQSVCSAGYDSSCTYCASSCSYNTLQGPLCGDNLAQVGFEECDGADLAGQTCSSQGFVGGTLACKQDCASFDVSACQTQTCGNGAREGTEQCDQSDLASQSCTTLGFVGGSLSCSGTCMFNTGACTTSNGGGTPGGEIGADA